MDLKEKLLFEKLSFAQRPTNLEIAQAYQKKWVEDIQNLFDKIANDWFADFKGDKLVSFIMAPLQRFDHWLEEYTTISLEANFVNGKTILFEPIASRSMNYGGRIDMYLRGNKQGKIHIMRTTCDQTKWELLNPASLKEISTVTKENLIKIFELWLF